MYTGIILLVIGFIIIHISLQLKNQNIVKKVPKKESDTSEDPNRTPPFKLEEFVKENYIKKILSYVGIILILFGFIFIGKTFFRYVPANKVGAIYVFTETKPKLEVRLNPGWNIINPINAYMLVDINKLYNIERK